MRNTRSWKHVRRDRKQYMFNGMAKSRGWEYDMVDGVVYQYTEMEPVNRNKRNTPFMIGEEA